MMVLFLKGACMGAADVVPGVSGGTMAFILGIYARLLRAIRSVDGAWIALVLKAKFKSAVLKMDPGFLIPLALGIAAALAFFTRIVPLPSLIITHPELVYGLFFGLIVASTAVLLNAQRPLRATDLVWLIAGCAAGLAVVTLVPTQTPDASWFIFLCGAVAISAMLLPGISGSFILLLLQKYAYVFDAIGRLDLSILLPFAAGCVLGLAMFSRLIGWLLDRFERPTLLFIAGILVGSLWKIWPFQDRIYVMVREKSRLVESHPVLPSAIDETTVASAALALAGVLLVLGIDWFARKRTHPGS